MPNRRASHQLIAGSCTVGRFVGPFWSARPTSATISLPPRTLRANSPLTAIPASAAWRLRRTARIRGSAPPRKDMELSAVRLPRCPVRILQLLKAGTDPLPLLKSGWWTGPTRLLTYSEADSLFWRGRAVVLRSFAAAHSATARIPLSASQPSTL